MTEGSHSRAKLGSGTTWFGLTCAETTPETGCSPFPNSNGSHSDVGTRPLQPTLVRSWKASASGRVRVRGRVCTCLFVCKIFFSNHVCDGLIRVCIRVIPSRRFTKIPNRGACRHVMEHQIQLGCSRISRRGRASTYVPTNQRA